MAQQKWAQEDPSRPVKMVSDRESRCPECFDRISEGDTIYWVPKEYKAYCEECGRDL